MDQSVRDASINVRVTRTSQHVVCISSQSGPLCDCIDQSEASECSYSPDRDRKLYLAVFETKGEFPDIITVLSLSLWYPE